MQPQLQRCIKKLDVLILVVDLFLKVKTISFTYTEFHSIYLCELNFNLQDSQAYILDDIIDYIKYLQLQVKVPFILIPNVFHRL